MCCCGTGSPGLGVVSASGLGCLFDEDACVVEARDPQGLEVVGVSGLGCLFDGDACVVVVRDPQG